MLFRSALEAEGYEVECLLRGLGELEGIQKIYVEHMEQASADKLN